LNFDLTLIYTPDVLYLSDPSASDIDNHNKLIFEYLTPRISKLVNETNLFVIAKLMSLSFNFNKTFEYLVQYYYLESLIKNYLEGWGNKNHDNKMDL
jgi:hypothetical protein